MKYDMVIYNGTVITLNSEFDIIENGIIIIKDRKFERFETGTRPQDLPEAKKTIDAKGSIILPGLVNTHTHLPMTLFRGLADDLPLHDWLENHIFPAEAKHINPENVQASTRLACAEMIMSGTTTCCDGYFFEDEVASAVSDSGLRAILAQGVIDFPAPGVPNPVDNIDHAVAYTQKWLGASKLIRPSIFCHSPYTCSAETLQKAKKAAASKDLLFQIHVAETKQEWDGVNSEHGISPIQYLDRIGILDRNTLLVHCIWVDDHDVETVAERECAVSHNPESNMKLASGIAPVEKFLEAGIPVGLGTDGCASNNTLDIFQAMDMTAKLHKVCSMDPTAMDAKTVLQMATIGGARAMGLEKEIGTLEIGKQADLIIVDNCRPHLTPMYNPASHLVYAANGNDVKTSIIGGRVVMEDSKLVFLNLEDILEQIAAIGESIRKQRG
ncbi:MAG: amidohydrolase family protein [Deltaproteobacteria bacterium]|nr:MAG: amidohydrolase family protein [Deltaproteobacteria bacterium]